MTMMNFHNALAYRVLNISAALNSTMIAVVKELSDRCPCQPEAPEHTPLWTQHNLVWTNVLR